MERLLKQYSLYLVSLFIVTILITSLITISYYKDRDKITEDFTSINLDNIDNLMIVAHPTDETIYGGAHLIEDNYLVVCISCGPKEELTNKFIDVITKTNDEYILLGYNEYHNSSKSNWSKQEQSIKEDLTNIIKLKDWKTITTHNKEGEYGNIHHKQISKIVTSLSTKSKLNYFGKYYSKKTINNYYEELPLINEITLNKKIKLIGTYKEEYLETSFNHIYNYEKWISYKEWTD